MSCPSEETFNALAFGHAHGVDAAGFFAHLEDCEDCRRVWRELARSVVPAPQSGEEPLARGATVGRYIVLDRLGAGGMGVVYSAYDPELDRKLAIKLLHPERGADSGKSEGRARLMREAKALARLAHPNVVTVHDVGSLGAQLFVAMELIDGRTLSAWLAEEKPGWRAILDAYRPAGQALAAAHRLGIVHRDFKPDNVLIDRSGRVRVVDFGLARTSGAAETTTDAPGVDGAAPLDAVTALTHSGSLLGTPAYMAPEQHLGLPAGAAADQFSFCVSLYQALWHERPFAGETLGELRATVMAGRVREPPANAHAPLWLFRIIATGLRPAADQRHPSMEALLAALDRDPARARRRGLIAVAALMLLAVAAVGLVRARASWGVCRGAEQKLAGVWDPERRRAVHAALLATRTPFAEAAFVAVAGALDQYTRAWTAMYTDACEATRVRGDQSEEVMELRAECLDGRRAEVRALVDVLAQADAQVAERAAQAAQRLPGLDECRNAEALRQVVRPPTGAEAHARVAALRTRLADAEARTRAGRYADARQRAEAVVADARALGYAPVQAEALIVRGEIEWRTGDPRAAVATLLDAAAAADAGRHDHARARALGEVEFVLADRLPSHAEAHRYDELARAAMARAGGDPQLELRLDDYAACVLYGEGRYGDALALEKRVLARREQTLGPDAPDVGESLVAVGEMARHTGDFAQAIASLRRAVAIYEKAYGTNHPTVALAWNDLGAALAQQRDYHGALDAYQKALAIREVALGPEHFETAVTLGNLADKYATLGDPARALPLLERALAIKVRSVGAGHASVAFTEEQLADVLMSLGRLDDALAHAERGLAIRERGFGPEHPLVGEMLTVVGKVRLLRHESAEALPPLERAVAILEHHEADPGLLPEARFTLARALVQAGRDRARARALAAAARAQSPSLRADVDAWLAQH
jgi:tetratricopeptide (TPR) repeat protein